MIDLNQHIHCEDRNWLEHIYCNIILHTSAPGIAQTCSEKDTNSGCFTCQSVAYVVQTSTKSKAHALRGPMQCMLAPSVTWDMHRANAQAILS